MKMKKIMELSELIIELQESEKLKNKLWGIIVYQQVGHGCLNGLWTNNYHPTNFMNEIARKKKEEEEKDKNIIDGEYTCAYIDPDNGTAYTGVLNINDTNGNEIYNFKWHQIRDREDTTTEFKGFGFKTGENQLTAIYWQL